jgi:hypothetical protein
VTLDDCIFVRRSERIAEWVVPEGAAGARYEERSFDTGAVVLGRRDAYKLDIDFGEEFSRLFPTGEGLTDRGPDDGAPAELLEFAIDTAAAGCLGPLGALHPGAYLLVRTPLKAYDSGFANWGNEGGPSPVYYRSLHTARHWPELPVKRFSASGKALPTVPPRPISPIAAHIVGSTPDRAPCLRQPLVALVVQDWAIVSGGHGVFLCPLAKPSDRPAPDEDLLIVLPVDAPWFAAPVGLEHLEVEAWPARIELLAQSLSYVLPD